jgi:iron only hydrogenase large subunit-like protein
MPDYKNGKIYKIWSPQGNEIYIGSTIQPLYKRFYHHKTVRNSSSKILFEKYDDVRIELIECVPCDNKEQLNKKEGEFIRNNNCVNKCIAGRTGKEYREDNKEKRKEWLEDNKEHIKEQTKQYRDNNKDKIKEYRQKKITCDCGRTFRFDDKARHERSKFHQDAIGGVSDGEDLN